MRLGLFSSALAVAFLLHSTVSTAQTVEKVKVKVKQSTDKNAEVKNLAAWDVIASGSNSVIVFRKQEGTTMLPTISRLDAYSVDKLMALGSQETPNKVDGKDLLMEGLVFFAGKPMTIGTVREPKNGTVAVYATVVDPALARPPETPKLLCTLEGLKVKGAGSAWIQGNNWYTKFLIRVSSDSSHMAVFSPELRDPATGTAHYMVAVLDRGLKTLWQGAINVRADARESWLSSALVDNMGVVHVAITSNRPDPDAKNRNKRDWAVFSADAAGASESKIPLDADLSFYSGMLRQLADGSILFAGTYGAKANNIEGFVCGRVSKGSSTLEKTMRYAIEGESSSRSFDIIDVLPRSDGGYYLASEIYRGLEYETYTRSVYGDVFVLSINATGKQEWTSLFRNLSGYENGGISARRAVVYDDQLFVFMVDTEKMAAKRKSGKEQTRGDMSDPYDIHVAFDRATGETKTKAILKGEKGTDFIADDLERIGKDKYFSLTLSGMMGGRYNPVTVEFSTEPK